MKLKVCTLNKTETEIDTSQDSLLSDVKKKVQEMMPHLDAARQLLIHQGKILNDSMRLSDYPNIKDGDRLVVMLPKAKQSVSSSKPPETTAPFSSSTVGLETSNVLTPTPSFSSTPPVPSPPAANAATGTPSQADPTPTATPLEADSTQVAPESTLVVGQELEQAVNNICGMGFEREQVLRAFHAAFNNPDRAVEYLMTGIPSRPQQAPGHPPVTESTIGAPTSGEATTAPTNVPPTRPDPLLALRQHPLFEQIRAAVQANPQLLPGMLQMISQQNPELAELIINNQGAFLEMMSEGERGGGNMGGLGGPVTIQVTPEQQEKVRHLEGLGFPEGAAVQALVVCDWDEDRAANFLFDNAGDFDEGDEEDVPMS